MTEPQLAPAAKSLFDKLVSTPISKGCLDASFSKSAAPTEEMQNASVEKIKHFKIEFGHII
jgi:hypothetical protein